MFKQAQQNIVYEKKIKKLLIILETMVLLKK